MGTTKVTIGGVDLIRDGKDHLIRDIDLAAQLGYDQPRMIRKLIARLAALATFGAVHVRYTVERTSMPRGGERSVEVAEYWLTQKQAILVCTRSDLPLAVEVTGFVVDVFLEAQRIFYEQRPFASRLDEIVAKIIGPEKTVWEECFTPSLVRELCKLYGLEWDGGRHPRGLARVNGKIYNLIFTNDISSVLRDRNPLPSRGNNWSQNLTPEARRHLQSELAKVESIARGSSSRRDFWMRMAREYSGGMLQLPFGKAG